VIMQPILQISDLDKTFTLHQQGGIEIKVFDKLEAQVKSGESVAITGASGKGKSSLLKLIYGTYRANGGHINVRHKNQFTNIIAARPHEILEIRRHTIGYVTQFLRVIPRVPAEQIVAEPLLERGATESESLERARDLLGTLNIPERLWHLSPMTFSGGEQQRVNIARGFAAYFPILLLDEPTASLDAENRLRVMALIEAARSMGSAVVAIFHDEAERRKVCSRELALQ
jgi:alpha-D-ribose 1-methylphosphonate 5-triphosphate synthase subunit PhnL